MVAPDCYGAEQKVATRLRAQRGNREGRAKAAPEPRLDLGSVIGHPAALASIRRQLGAGSISHAYWVTGPPQVGKTTLALSLAAELLAAQGWPGGPLAHPDLWVDDRDSSIGIDRIRAHESEIDLDQGPTLQHFLSLLAYAGKAKVAVIGNAERLSLEAANSLLRLLEEPRPGTVILLCTSRPDSEHLPSTLRSRCQQLLLGPVETETIRAWLISDHGISPENAQVAAAVCLGRPGLGLEMGRDPALGRRASERLDQLLACTTQGPGGWLELSRQLAERGTDREVARGALRVWASFLRDCCCLAGGAPELIRWPDAAAGAADWASRLGLPGCSRRYDLALDALARIDEMSTPRLVLDRFLLLTFGDGSGSTRAGEPQPVSGTSDQR